MDNCHSIIDTILFKVLSVYTMIFTIVFVLNAATLALVAHFEKPWDSFTFIYGRIPIFVSGNFLIGVLVRNEHVVNAMFRTMLAIPRHWPLTIRRYCAQVYHYGGIHSGCNAAATIWYTFFVILAIMDTDPMRTGAAWIASLILMVITLTLLIIMIAFATPCLRTAWHDGFEAVHRQGGWVILLLFWGQIILSAKLINNSTGREYHSITVKSPTLWIHSATTLLILYPWMHVRKMNVTCECLSDHVIKVHFPGLRPHAGTAVRVAKTILNEYHAFAVIPEPHEAPGFSILVSNAGDWTSDLIRHPRSSLWIRQITAFGVVSVVKLFSPVVVIATGSGIGPCLSMFTALLDHQFRIVWSTRNPVRTYGTGVLNSVRAADPNATIIDTDAQGRQDIVSLAENKFRETRAEAIVIISRAGTTKKVIRAMKRKDIPCFGPIFDS
jgi:NAD(P)H-flavin reductase